MQTTNDIVERLRNPEFDCADEAADEIERLREVIDQLRRNHFIAVKRLRDVYVLLHDGLGIMREVLKAELTITPKGNHD